MYVDGKVEEMMSTILNASFAIYIHTVYTYMHYQQCYSLLNIYINLFLKSSWLKSHTKYTMTMKKIETIRSEVK
jgi:hypothetical protein